MWLTNQRVSHALLILFAFSSRSVAYRTSVCVKKHEEFSMCSWRCPPTCVNIKILRMPDVRCGLPWECRIGCRCVAGYLRDEVSKECVLVNQCPENSSCPPGEILGYNLQCVRRGRMHSTNQSLWENYVDG